MDTSLDTRYILARDNFTCQHCSRELSTLAQAVFAKVGAGDEIATNLKLICKICSVLNPSLVAPSLSYGGRLIVVTGPMFASKSTVTRSLYNKYRVFNPACAWIKPSADDRADGVTKTHNEEQFDAITISAARPDKHLEELLQYDVLAIDEAQFFSDRLLHVVHRLLRANKLIIANGLQLTAQRGLFGIMHYLMAEADDIISLKAVCSRCKTIDTASRTKSYKKLPSVQTGGADAYYAICPICDGANHEDTRS